MENTKFSSQEKGIKIDIKFKVITVLKDKGRVLLTIKVELFKNSEVNNYPFELSFFLVGEFDTDETDEKKIEEFLKYNGTAILFPYVRSTISSLTTLTGQPHLLLPTYNIRNLLADEDIMMYISNEELEQMFKDEDEEI